MAKDKAKAMLQNALYDMADYLESGKVKGAKIAVCGIGSELGEDCVLSAAEIAAKEGIDVYYIGSLVPEYAVHVDANSEDEAVQKMDELLKGGKADAAVAMHHTFPIGTSTVGMVAAPATGMPYFVSTTTGTAAVNRFEAMLLAAIYGIATAKCMGYTEPSLGILNIDGARQLEIALKKLADNGYNINFAKSQRKDGGCIMRGNDLLSGSADVIAVDSLTGNVLMKLLSSLTSGGAKETTGYGYGPGICENMQEPVFIISRASSTPVIINAIKYAAKFVSVDYKNIIAEEFNKANKAGLKNIIEENSKRSSKSKAEVKAPPKEVVDESIAGIDVMDLEDAVSLLWENGIYAESGMGCTGPIAMVSAQKLNIAMEVLAKGGYIAK